MFHFFFYVGEKNKAPLILFSHKYRFRGTNSLLHGRLLAYHATWLARHFILVGHITVFWESDVGIYL